MNVPATTPHGHAFAASAGDMADHIKSAAAAGLISPTLAQLLLAELQQLGPVLFQFFLSWAGNKLHIVPAPPVTPPVAPSPSA